jgi:hypothetical protein
VHADRMEANLPASDGPPDTGHAGELVDRFLADRIGFTAPGA